MNSDRHEDVWSRFVSGDVTSFRKLFKKYYGEMYGYGLKLCNRPCMVEDAIQELFKNLWERRADLGHIDSANVYLFVSLRRRILRKLKKKKRMNGDLDEVHHKTQITFGPDEIIVKSEDCKEKRENLHQALNNLSNRQKEIIYLHFYGGMSYGEIEEVLSINRQSVRNHMFRAMENLRTVLDKEIMKLIIMLLLTLLFVF